MGGKGYEAKFKGNLTPKQRQRLGIPKDAMDLNIKENSLRLQV